MLRVDFDLTGSDLIKHLVFIRSVIHEKLIRVEPFLARGHPDEFTHIFVSFLKFDIHLQKRIIILLFELFKPLS